jgi:hypothetical protein
MCGFLDEGASGLRSRCPSNLICLQQGPADLIVSLKAGGNGQGQGGEKYKGWKWGSGGEGGAGQGEMKSDSEGWELARCHLGESAGTLSPISCSSGHSCCPGQGQGCDRATTRKHRPCSGPRPGQGIFQAVLSLPEPLAQRGYHTLTIPLGCGAWLRTRGHASRAGSQDENTEWPQAWTKCKRPSPAVYGWLMEVIKWLSLSAAPLLHASADSTQGCGNPCTSPHSWLAWLREMFYSPQCP